MDHPSSRFSDPLKDYGFDPSASDQGNAGGSNDLDGPSLEIYNNLIALSGGLNLLPADPFEGRCTPGSGTSRRLDWLKDFTARDTDDLDIYDDVNPEELLDGAPLSSKLDFYMYGHSDPLSHADERFGSWELPENHPIKASLISPGRSDFYMNTNWYERIQWAYRSALPRDNSKRSLYVLGSDEEHELLLELGRFRKAASYGGTKLLISLLNFGINSHPTDYLDLQEAKLAYAEQFYARKFPNDRQFLHDGIVYTVVVGGSTSDTLVPYTVAKKIYSNDQKGKQALCDALYNKGSHGVFAFPIQCVVNFLGIRVVAEPLVPLNSSPPYSLVDELLRECKCPSGNVAMDITTSLFNSGELSQCLREMATYLHVSSWPIPFESSDVDGLLCDGAYANVQRCDGKLHIRQTQEVLPCIVEPAVSVDPLYSFRFRPELCHSYKKPLTCTLKSHVIFNDAHDGDVFKDAFYRLQVVLEDCISRCNMLLDSWDISMFFHSFGINMRYIGLAYEKAVYAGFKNLLAAEMVARAVKHLWDEKLQEFISLQTWSCDTIMRTFLNMLNDVFGIFPNSSNFWSQSIIPEIARHFNLVKLEGISHRVIPHTMLKNALEYNLCILLPPIKGGNTYRSAITPEDFEVLQTHPLLNMHIDYSISSRSTSAYRTYKGVLTALFPKTKLVYPSREVSMYKVAHRLCGKDITNGIGDIIACSNSFGLGFCKHIESKLVGTGYPCEPACIYNSRLSCVNHQQSLTGLNLFCLAECLLQMDAIKRIKLILSMGYHYLSHRQLDDALSCAHYVVEHSPPICSKAMEAELLSLQCYCLMGNTEKCKELYDKMVVFAKRLEGRSGLLSLQLSLINCFEAWWRHDYAKCASYAELAKDATVAIAGLKQYEWLPIAMSSLLGHCYERLRRNLEATKTQREVVHLCRVSQLPRYTLCNVTWMFVEYLLRNDFYEEGCPLSMELIPILEKEFGPLSVECLRCLYVSAWSNHQVGCAQFIHPFLFLSNSDRIIGAEIDIAGIHSSPIVDEFISAANCSIRRMHCENALGLYKSLYERLTMIRKQCRQEVVDYIKIVHPSADIIAVQQMSHLNTSTVAGALGEINATDDEALTNLLEDCDKNHEHMLLVIKNLLTLKVLSLSSQHSMLVSQKLYNAYVSQVADGYVWKMCVGSDVDDLHDNPNGGYKPAPMYGSNLERHPEKFNASVSMDEKSMPHRGHELRSIEELLLKEPTSSEAAICEVCRLELEDSEFTPADWFDRLFGLETTGGTTCNSKFILALDTLRHFLTPSKRLIILSYIANISNVKVDSTTTFKELRSNLAAVMTRH